MGPASLGRVGPTLGVVGGSFWTCNYKSTTRDSVSLPLKLSFLTPSFLLSLLFSVSSSARCTAHASLHHSSYLLPNIEVFIPFDYNYIALSFEIKLYAPSHYLILPSLLLCLGTLLITLSCVLVLQ